MSTVADNQLKLLKDYDAFAQEKASQTSATVLQELVKKEQEAENIMHGLNKQYTLLADKVRGPEEQQSVPGRDTGES